MKVLYLIDQWPFPTNSGARVHDKLMLACLTNDYRAEVACWAGASSAGDTPHLPPDRILPHRKLGWRNILAATAGMVILGRPLHCWEFLSRGSKEKLASIVARVDPDVIVLSSADLASVVPFLKTLTGAKLIVDTHDVQLQRCQSIYESLPTRDVAERLRHWLLIRSYRLIEQGIYRDIDVAWVLKDEDRDLLESYGSCRRIEIVPNVVDPDTVSDGPHAASTNALTHGVTCVFVGKYSYKPNEQSALMLLDWFAAEPLAGADVKLYLIGVDPSGAMLRKAKALRNVVVTGPVASLGDYLLPVDAIFMAPILAGGGVKRKIIEAMVYGCPVLTTPVGAEGLDLVDGQTAELCSIDAFPERVMQLIGDRDKRIRLSTRGRTHVLSKFGYDKLRSGVRESLDRLARVDGAAAHR